MDLGAIDLRQLESFCSVARSGSFSKASAALGIGQPSLSRQVRKLEAEVGAQLLYRNGRGVALTPAGAHFFNTVSELIAQLRSAYDAASDQNGAPGGRVTLGLPTSLSALLGVPVLRRLEVEAPNIQLHLVDGFSGHVLEWLLAGRVDLAVLHDARHAPTIGTEHLLSEDLYLIGCAPPPFAFVEDGRLVTMREVARLPLVLPGSDHGLRRKLERSAAMAGVQLDVRAEVDSFNAIRELMLTGFGYTILPVGCMAREIEGGLLQAWRIVQPDVSNVMVLAAAQNRPFTRAMAEVRAALRKEAARIEGGALAGDLLGDGSTRAPLAALLLQTITDVRN